MTESGNDKAQTDSVKKRPPRWRRLLYPIARVAALSYVGAGAVLFGWQSRFVYFPRREIDDTPDQWGLSYEDVFVTTSDAVKIHGWYVPAKDARGVVLFCHGNGGNISHRIDSLLHFNRMGLATFIFDYRGYGRSEGKPSEEGTYLDAEAAWGYLVETRQEPPARIVIFGRSLGGTVAAHLARGRQAGAVVIESAFTSAPDMAAKMLPIFPARLLCRFDYDTVAYVREVSCPVLVVHSRDDEMIPLAHGRRIYEAANEPKEFVEITGTHDDGFLTSGGAYEERLRRFIARYLPQPGDPP